MKQDRHRRWTSVPLASVMQWLVGFVLIGLVLVTSTRLRILPGDLVEASTITGQGNALRQALYVLGILLVGIAVGPLRQTRKFFDFPISLLLLLAWCAASIGWSVAPDIAARRFVLLVMVIWLCFRIVDELGAKRTADIVCYTSVGLLIANLIAVAALPGLAIHHNAGALSDPSIVGAWRGVLADKNMAGPLCAMTILLLLFGTGRFTLIIRIVLMVLAALFLVRTQSKTSMALTGLAALSGLAFLRYNPAYRRLLVPLLGVFIAISTFLLWTQLPPFLAEIESSRDAFTGRIQIWRVLVAYINDNPWLGAGYASFWGVGQSGLVNRYSNGGWINQVVAEGHNGYLDLWSQIGVPGVIGTVVVLLLIPIAKLLMNGVHSRPNGALQLAILVFIAGHNFTESSLLVPDQYLEMMAMMAIASIGQLRRDARHTQRPPLSVQRLTRRDRRTSTKPLAD